eukprot:12212027-Alexandrium_andersonii.AAC.1
MELRIQSQVYQDEKEIKDLLGERADTDEAITRLRAAFQGAIDAVAKKREELVQGWTQKEADQSLDAQGASSLISSIATVGKEFMQSTEVKAARSAANDIGKHKTE